MTDRRYLTIAFCDLVASTTLAEQLDPEELYRIQEAYRSLVVVTAKRFHGHVASFQGDGALIYFGYPIAHDRDAERAVRFGIALRESLPNLDLDVVAGSIGPLSVRIGIHSGLVLISPESGDGWHNDHAVVGQVVNIASRLQAEASANGIAISSETRDLIAGRFEIVFHGARSLKGLRDPVPIYGVVREVSALGPLATNGAVAGSLVGRQEPLSRLGDIYRETSASSKLRVVRLSGDAGVGKTRLGVEFVRQLGLPEGQVLAFQCSNLFSSTPLYPISSFLRAGAARFGTEADAIDGLLRTLGMTSTPEGREVLSTLIGKPSANISLTPAQLKRRQFDLLLTMFAHAAQAGPLLVWVEDAHWVDPTTAELLETIVQRLANRPALLLITTRTYPRALGLPKSEAEIELGQLKPDESIAIARSVPGARCLDAAAIQRIITLAGGIPLFIEQLTFVKVRSMEMPDSLPATGLPITLTETLSERLDRLPAARRTLQAVACFGRPITPEVLARVLDLPSAEAWDQLDALVRVELMRPASLEDRRPTYAFRHALLEQLAHESLTQSNRRALHDRIATVLSETETETLPEVIAHHLTEAGRFVDAVNAWRAAAVMATRRAADVEAISHLRRGLAVLERLPEAPSRDETELLLQAALIGPLVATAGPSSQDLLACCRRGTELAMAGPGSPLVFAFLYGQFTHDVTTGRISSAAALAERFIALSESRAYASGVVIGHRILGLALLARGEFRKAIAALRRAIALYVPERDEAITVTFGQNAKVNALAVLSLALFVVGDIDEALAAGAEAFALADRLNHPHTSAIAIAYVGWVLGFCGAAELLQTEAERLMRIADEHGLRAFGTQGQALWGWARCQQGDLERGAASLERAIATFDQAGFQLTLPGFLIFLADAKRRLGLTQEATILLERARAVIDQSGEAWIETEYARQRVMLLRQSNIDQSLAVLLSGAEYARSVGARTFERFCEVTMKSADGLAPDEERKTQFAERAAAALERALNRSPDLGPKDALF